jgi:hypothetical protein
VKSHFTTVAVEHLGAILHTTPATDPAVFTATTAVRDLQSAPQTSRGLPVGPDGSAPLGVVALLPVDRALAREGITYIRWMDDIVIFLRDLADAEWVISLVGTQLRAQGQSLNQEKIDLDEIGSYSFGAGSGAEYGSHEDLFDDPASVLERLAEAENPAGVTSALGVLRRNSDPSGVPVLKRHRWVHETFPKQSAAYFRTVIVRPGSEDWILDRLLEPTALPTAASQLHLAALVSRDHVSPSTGAQAYEKAANLDRVSFAPLANELLVVAGHSEAKRRQRRREAIETADHLPDLDAKRAALAALEGGGLGNSERAGLRYLVLASADLTPTEAYLLAA